MVNIGVETFRPIISGNPSDIYSHTKIGMFSTAILSVTFAMGGLIFLFGLFLSPPFPLAIFDGEGLHFHI